VQQKQEKRPGEFVDDSETSKTIFKKLKNYLSTGPASALLECLIYSHKAEVVAGM